MDDPAKFAAAMCALAEAEIILEFAKLKIAEERLAADPELRRAAIEHFRSEALRHAAQEDR